MRAAPGNCWSNKYCRARARSALICASSAPPGRTGNGSSSIAPPPVIEFIKCFSIAQRITVVFGRKMLIQIRVCLLHSIRIGGRLIARDALISARRAWRGCTSFHLEILLLMCRPTLRPPTRTAARGLSRRAGDGLIGMARGRLTRRSRAAGLIFIGARWPTNSNAPAAALARSSCAPARDRCCRGRRATCDAPGRRAVR